MDRQILYPAQILPETALLNMATDAMVGIGELCNTLFQGDTVVSGLVATQTLSPSMQVSVSPGAIYSAAPLESTPFSSLPANTAQTTVKQGLSLDTVLLSCPAPITSGHSINYVIQVRYQDVDSDAVTLPYYNSSNPTGASYSGPNNSGTSQNTRRKGVCVISVVSGVSAATGTQVNPAVTSGYIGLYSVTVNYGQTSILTGNITKLSTFPAMRTKVQNAVSTTTPNTFTAVQSGIPAVSGNDFPIYSQIQSIAENIIDALPLPVVQGANSISLTAAAVTGTGGTVSVPAGVYFSLCREIQAGFTGTPAFVTSSAYTTPNLTASSTYFLRCQFVSGVPTFYVQKGALTDTVPVSRKGTINATSGGGFFSTPIDMCLAMITTGVNNTVPNIKKINNLAKNDVTAPILNGSGTLFLPFDPFVKSAKITAGMLTAHASLVSNILHGGTGWIGGAYSNFLPQGIIQPIQQSQNNTWLSSTGGTLIGSNNIVGDTFNATAEGIIDHISGKAYWKTYHGQHTIGDTANDGSSKDELLLGHGQKNLQAVDYDSGWPIAYTNCVNAIATWTISR